MSWGERSCSMEKAPKNEYGGCSYSTMPLCNVDCKYYTWYGVTEPDSKPNKLRRKLSNKDRNSPCFCGSGKKYKKCCLGKNL